MAGKAGHSGRSRGGIADRPTAGRAGGVDAEQVRHVLQVQKLSHRPFGDLAERLYGVDPRAVEDAWVEQYLRTAGTSTWPASTWTRSACGC